MVKPIITVTTSNKSLIWDARNWKRVMRGIGPQVMRRARAMIKPGGPGQKSAPGQPPLSRITVTAKFKRRLAKTPTAYFIPLVAAFTSGVSRDGTSAYVKNTAFYSKFLEGGAKGIGKYHAGNIEPRPFISAAWDQLKDQLIPDILEAAAQGITLAQLRRNRKK